MVDGVGDTGIFRFLSRAVTEKAASAFAGYATEIQPMTGP
jgi:hypothetical protein